MNNPPAFPNDRRFDDTYAELRGMTLRDYFAAKALQGFLSNTSWTEELGRQTKDKTEMFDAVNALRSYAAADAMLAERAKTQ